MAEDNMNASEILQIASAKKPKFVKRFKNRPTVKTIGGIFSSINQGASNLGKTVVKSRRRNIIYNRNLGRPLVGSGIKKQGRGRPRGTVKYYIPGQGPVGVYEYRIYLRSQLRAKRMEIQNRNSLTPEQRYALQQLQQRQQAYQNNPENRTIVDTTGNVPAGDINKEISDAANLVP